MRERGKKGGGTGGGGEVEGGERPRQKEGRRGKELEAAEDHEHLNTTLRKPAHSGRFFKSGSKSSIHC